MDWKTWFSRMSYHPPVVQSVKENVRDDTWELIYQAFKARFIAEQNEQLREMYRSEGLKGPWDKDPYGNAPIEPFHAPEEKP